MFDFYVISVWVYFWAVYAVHLTMSLFLYKCHSILITVVFQYSLKAGHLIPPALQFSRLFWLLGVFCVSIQFFNLLYFCKKNALGILIGMALNLQITLGSTVSFQVQKYNLFMYAKKYRKTIEWERLEISSRKLEIKGTIQGKDEHN